MIYSLKQQKISKIVIFSFMITCSTPNLLKAHLLTRATKKITRSYNDIKKRVVDEYETFFAEHMHPQETVWDWDAMPKESAQLPAHFLWGSQSKKTTTEQQAEKTITPEEKTSTNSKATASKPKTAQKTTVNEAKKTYYLSLDWNAIEPQEGQFNQELLKKHAQLCSKLARQNTKPIIILCESSVPQWFADKEGFLIYENISFFVRYAQKVFTALKSTPAYWIPFLNPNEYARIKHPYDLADLLDCLEHMLIAHRNTYKTLKKMIGNDQKTLIGISKQMDPIKAWNTLNPIEQNRATKLNQALHDAFYSFINHGSMEIYFSDVTKNNFAHSTATSFDFIAITYTGQRYLQSDDTIIYSPNKNELYAQGLYAALKKVSRSLDKKTPILVIETDKTDSDVLQPKPEQVIRALQRAYAEKCAVWGYISL